MRKRKRHLARGTAQRGKRAGIVGLLQEHSTLFLLLGLLLLALWIRLAALESLKQSVYGSSLLWDERYYHEWAQRIASGTFESLKPYRAAPLPAYLNAAVYALFSPESDNIRLLHVVLGSLSCLLISLIGKEVAGWTVGLLAFLLAALYKPLIFSSILPMKTALAVCLFAAAAYLFLAGLRTLEWPALAGLGLATGLLLNVQGNAVVLIPAALACLGLELFLRRRADSGPSAAAVLLGAYLLGLALGTAPFAIRNYRVAGEFVLTTPQSGFALYAGNRLGNPDPYFRPVPFAIPEPSEQMIQMTIEASRRQGRTASAAEASAFWARETLREMAGRPGQAVWKLLQKTLAVFHRSETCDHYHLGFVSSFVPILRLPFLAFWGIFPFGMAGALMAARNSRPARYLLALAVSYAGTLVLFYPGARFRLPLVAVLLPLAAAGILAAALAVRAGESRRLGAPAAAFLLAAVVQFLPLRAADDLAAFYNTHAILLHERGRTPEAISYWRSAAERKEPYSAFSNLALAGLYLNARDAESATRSVLRIPDDSFAAALKYDFWGDIHVVRGRLDLAAGAYARALGQNSGLRATREKLIRVYDRLDAAKAAAERERLQDIAAFYAGS